MQWVAVYEKIKNKEFGLLEVTESDLFTCYVWFKLLRNELLNK